MPKPTRRPLDRFTPKVRVIPCGGCWEWTAGLSVAGYGMFFDGERDVLAHRWSYAWFVGALVPGLQIDHLCRNRMCVNPMHLEQVTARENQLRGFGFSGRKARQTHCIRGHEFTPENTYRQPGTNKRTCRTCVADRERRRPPRRKHRRA